MTESDKTIRTRSKEIKDWYKSPMLGITLKQLRDFKKAGLPMKAYCVAHEDMDMRFEVYIDITESTGQERKRMVLIKKENDERRVYRTETACRVLLYDLGFKVIEFWSKGKRVEEGLSEPEGEVKG